MRQRLGLADALVKDPSVVILDEPTASIDPAGVTDVLALIQSLARDNGVTVLLSSHLLHQVHQVCDRVAIFNKGRILAQGRMAQLAEELAGDQVVLEVGVDGPADQVEAALRAVTGVTDVTRNPKEPALWNVTGPQAIRGHLALDLAARGKGIEQLRRVGDELDEIYLRYFERDEGNRDHAA